MTRVIPRYPREPWERPMMLDVDHAIASLIESGLIRPSWLIDEEMTIRCAARRNRNLRVEGAAGGYLIRQPDPLAADGLTSLRAEASFYELCERHAEAAPLLAYLPRLAYRDPKGSFHALEFIPDTLPLDAYLRLREPTEFHPEPARLLGSALGTLHRVYGALIESEPGLAGLERRPPRSVTLHRPTPAMLAGLGRATLRLIGAIQSQANLVEKLDDAARCWSASCVIHGDIRSDNILVRCAGPERDPGPPRIWIVDWEFVQIGDPAWDLAGVLVDHLVFWTSSMPMDPSTSAQEMVASARYPLQVIQAGIRACWLGYLASAGLAARDATGLLSRAVELSANRLVLACYELTADADDLSIQDVILLQIAANILEDPGKALFQLYGIPPESHPG